MGNRPRNADPVVRDTEAEMKRYRFILAFAKKRCNDCKQRGIHLRCDPEDIAHAGYAASLTARDRGYGRTTYTMKKAVNNAIAMAQLDDRVGRLLQAHIAIESGGTPQSKAAWRDLKNLGDADDELFFQNYTTYFQRRFEKEGLDSALRLVNVEQIPEDYPALSDDDEPDRYDGLRKALRTLSYRERVVVDMRWFKEMTLEEVGQVFKVPRERIRMIEIRLMAKLRHPMRLDLLKRCL